MTKTKRTAVKLKIALVSALTLGFSTNLSCKAETFQFDLFKKLAKNKGQSNLLVSPFSVETAMTMTALGASGNTFSSMSDTLELGDSKTNIGARALKNLKSLNESDPDTNLKIVNSLIGNKEVKFSKVYTSSMNTQFQASLISLDFSAKDSLNKINSWVKEKSGGKISSIINKVEPSAKLYLLNAIYFKSSWQEPFDTKLTAQKPFHSSEEKSVQVPMMVADRKNFKYFADFQFEALRLPYKNGRYSMLLFLPDETSSLKELESQLDESNWEKWLQSFEERSGKVSMPKFKIADNMKLKDPLSAMGMSSAFDSFKADFSSMTEKGSKTELFLTEVFHKTFIEVNEEGSEAAAATAAEASAKSLYFGSKHFEMILNRPFLFALYDQKTKKILFLGHIVDPVEE